MQKIKGTVKYIDIELGFWAIITDSGVEIRPVNFPNQLKLKGRKIVCHIEWHEEEMSFIQWGRPAKIVSFTTID